MGLSVRLHTTHLWLRLLAFGDFAVLPSTLYRYTVSASSASGRHAFRQAAAGKLAERLHAERRTQGTESTDWQAEERAYLSVDPPAPSISAETQGEYIVAARLLHSGQYALATKHFQNYLPKVPPASMKAAMLRVLLPALPVLRWILIAKERIVTGRPPVLTYIEGPICPNPPC